MKQTQNNTAQDRFLRVKEVAALMGISKSSVWGYVKQIEGFPQPFKIGKNVTVWRLSEIIQWMDSQAERAS